MRSIDPVDAAEVPEAAPASVDEARYVYCVALGSGDVSLGKIGIAESEVYTICQRDLCAVVHDCAPVPYQNDDDGVVRAWILAHQNVVDTAWRRLGTVLPLRFDTIIERGEKPAQEMVQDWLAGDYENLKNKMEKVRGKAEYGVQVFWDPKVIAEELTRSHPDLAELEQEISALPRGKAYMHRQRLESALRGKMESRADECFRDFYGKIKACVDDLRVEKVKKGDDGRQMLANFSCLTDHAGSLGLGEELEQIGRQPGFSVRFTGPWPPYSFVAPG